MSKFLNYLDFDMANNLLEGFNKSTGFVTAILDLNGNILSKSGWRQICTDFHRKNPETALNCSFSDTKTKKMDVEEKYHFYKCLNGLIDVRVPIIIRGEHIANLFSGQFFFEEPNISFFKKQAKKYKFDENEYIKALGKVPVLSKEEVETAMDFLQNITQLIIEMTVEKIEQIESNEEMKKREEKLVYVSYHDHLTGLYNRRFFEEELERLNTKENLPISIIMCDVNGLKMVNDSFGHESGDILLKKAANTIKKACRENDIIARISGDDFIVLLPKTGVDDTLKVSNKIKALSAKEKISNIELSISCGYDTKVSDKQSIIKIIGNAENNMYRHKLYEHSSMRSKNIDLIMNALFEKSNREAMHSRRVSSICKAIGSKMNLDNSTISKIGIAGLIHDIGKIGIDEKILNKPGSLNIEERKEIERHPEIGWRILSSTVEFSELAEFILNHHEKWDGSGYPNGIKYKKIPLVSRIIAVADAYDAMTRARSYRKEMNRKDVIKELKRCSKTQFDPEIVDIFVNQVL